MIYTSHFLIFSKGIRTVWDLKEDRQIYDGTATELRVTHTFEWKVNFQQNMKQLPGEMQVSPTSGVETLDV